MKRTWMQILLVASCGLVLAANAKEASVGPNEARTEGGSERISFGAHLIDPDANLIDLDHTLRADIDGYAVLTLRGRPNPSWLEALDARHILLVQALPPASYLVKARLDVLGRLKADMAWVRGLTLLTPTMKLPPPLLVSSPLPVRRVLVHAIEEQGSSSILSYLDAHSLERAIRVERADGHVTYAASLTDDDLLTVAGLDDVYLLSIVSEIGVTSERQGVLTLGALGGTSNGMLPPMAPDYIRVLSDLGLGDRVGRCESPHITWNTLVAVLDSGFDAGPCNDQGSPMSEQIPPDFKDAGGPFIKKFTSAFSIFPPPKYCWDSNTHGTLVASIIGGSSNRSQAGCPPGDGDVRTEGPSGYRFSLGIAPGVPMIIDKFYDCHTPDRVKPDDPFAGFNYYFALQRVGQVVLPSPDPSPVKVVNLSSNALNCFGYDVDAAGLDSSVRDKRWLITVSAGNTDDLDVLPEDKLQQAGCATSQDKKYVRSPATAKNVLAVGATDNVTPDGAKWTNEVANKVSTCAWNQNDTDARNIPSFSSQGAFSMIGTPASGMKPNHVVKPDLVAPGVRVTGPFARYAPSFCPGPETFCNSLSSPIATFDDPSGAFDIGFSAGTSFAAPAVAGAAAVVRKWYQVLTLKDDASAALTKAILINGARDLRGAHVKNKIGEEPPDLDTIGPIPDKYQGWGMLNFDRLLGYFDRYFFKDECDPGMQCDRDPLVTGQDWTETLTVADGSKDVHVTLVWSDPEGSVNAGRYYAAVNDLDLQAADDLARFWQGNVFDGAGKSALNPSSSADAINNVEQIIIPAGLLSTGAALHVRVLAKNVMRGSQTFALFAENARLGSCVHCPRLVDFHGPGSLPGGASGVFTVDLDDIVPSGSGTVTLASSNPAAAFLPSTVVVPTGQKSVDVVVTTRSVSTSTSLTLSASFAGTTLNAPLTVTPSQAAPTITAITPNTGSVAGANQVVVYGTNLGSSRGVVFGNLNEVPAQTVTSTSLTAWVPGWPYGAAGAPVPVDVKVVATSTPNGDATAPNAYTYYYPPELRSISPASGSTNGGDTVIIGAQFILTGTYLVTIGGVPASFTISANTITAMTPPHASGPVDVVVTNPGGSGRLIGQYTYIGAPTITTLSLNAGPIAGNQTVTISGANLSGGTAIFGGSTATTISNNGTQMIVTTPAHAAGAVNVVVTTVGGSVTVTNGYSYVNPPTIASVSPSAGPTAGGQSVTITGTNLSGASVTFGGTDATVTGNLGTSITATTPAHAVGLVNVVVTTSGGTATLTNGYTFNAPPTLTAVSPNTGSTGGSQSIAIAGTGLSGVSVTFGGSTATVTAPGTTQITVTNPAHAAGTVSVVVTNQWGSAQLTNGFTYYAPPTITSVNPNVGPAAGGQNVAISGTNLTGATATFGGADAEVTSTSATQMTVTTPPHEQGSLDVGVDVVATNPSRVSAVLSLGYTYSGGPTCTRPDATITTPAQVCACEAPFTASVPGGQGSLTYDWSITGGTINSGQGTGAIAWTPTVIGTVTLNVTLRRWPGCSSSGTATSRAQGPAACVHVCNPPPPPLGGD